MATLKTTNIKHGSSSNNNIVLNSDGSTTFHNISNNVGKILQCKTKVFNTKVTTSSTSFVEISSAFRVQIAPISATSEIIVTANLFLSINYTAMGLRLMSGTGGPSGGGEVIVNEPAGGLSEDMDGTACFYSNNDPMMPVSITGIEDAGTTNNRYYTVFWKRETSSGNATVASLNAYNSTTNNYDDYYQGVSSIVVTEVAT